MAKSCGGSAGWSHGAALGLRFLPPRRKDDIAQLRRRAGSLTRATVVTAPLDSAPLGAGSAVPPVAREERSVDEDAEIVRRVRAGDVEAFGALVERWQRPLFRLALRYAGERTAAEDLCQEVFLRAFRALAGFRGNARFST